MADTKTSAESAAAALDGTELVRIVQSGSSVRTTVGDMSRIAQVVNTQTGANATSTVIIPRDNTIPQNTEGLEVMTLAITPTNASSTLLIDVVMHGAATNASRAVTAALFQDDGVNAIAVGSQFQSAGDAMVQFRHKMTAGTTSATTFKVRGGSSTSEVFIFNGAGGPTALYGGTLASSITITEILPF